MWIPWWKNAVLIQKTKLFGSGSNKWLFGLQVSNLETFHPRTQWMLWYGLSIVYCQIPPASPCVTPQHIPYTITGKNIGWTGDSLTLFCFQKHKIFVWPWPAMAGWWGSMQRTKQLMKYMIAWSMSKNMASQSSGAYRASVLFFLPYFSLAPQTGWYIIALLWSNVQGSKIGVGWDIFLH